MTVTSIENVNDVDLDLVASEIAKRRMLAPAIFVLEMYKPLLGVFRESCTFVSPLLTPLVGSQLVNLFSKILESSHSVESLILRLENIEAR